MLLLLVCLTTFAWLHAETATFTCKDNYGSSTVTASTWKLNDYLTFTYAKGSNSNPPAYNKAGDVRAYAGNTVTLTATNDYKIEAIVFTLSSQGKSRYPSVIASTGLVGAQAVGDSECTWSGDATTVTFTVGDKSIYATDKTKAGQLCYTSVTVTYSKAGPATQVTTPSITPASGAVEAGTKVTISCATEGAEIEYVLNGGSDYIKYTEPIEITEATTIAAYATKDGLEMSDIATAVYTIKKPVVATPTFDPAPGAVAKGTEVTITCATEGATLMYQVNGGDIQVGESPVTVVINEATTIEVIASKDGYVDSEAKAVYSIIGEAPANPTATFDFTQPSTLQPAMEMPTNTSPTDKERAYVDNVVFYNNYALVQFISPADAPGSNRTQLWPYSDAAQVRAYAGSTIKITVAESLTIEKIEFVGATKDAALSAIKVADGYTGTYSVNGTTATWIPAAVNALAETVGERESVVFSVTGKPHINTITITTTGIPTGVEDVTVDENAPVEYYNLQGVRVDNPENGIYIRRQGSKVSKVLVR